MKPYRPLILSCFLALGAGSVRAQVNNPLISQTIGSGSNESYFVVDFEDGTTDPSYAFGYKYNGTQTGADLIAALAADTNPPLVVGYVPGYGPGQSPFGVAINSFAYNGHSEAGFTANEYWNYWNSSDGINWQSANNGPSDTPLYNGSWDGWSWDVNNDNLTPRTPQVPEASGLIALAQGVGLLALAQYRRRRKARRS